MCRIFPFISGIAEIVKWNLLLVSDCDHRINGGAGLFYGRLRRKIAFWNRGVEFGCPGGCFRYRFRFQVRFSGSLLHPTLLLLISDGHDFISFCGHRAGLAWRAGSAPVPNIRTAQARASCTSGMLLGHAIGATGTQCGNPDKPFRYEWRN